MPKGYGDRYTPDKAQYDLFVAKLLETGLDASEAYRQAGFAVTERKNAKGSPAGIGGNAWNLMQHPEVRRRIRAALAPLLAASMVTAERVLGELAGVAFAQFRDIADWESEGDSFRIKGADEINDFGHRAIKSISVVRRPDGNERLEVRLHDKVQALDRLGRYLKLFVDTGDSQLGDAVEGAIRAIGKLSDMELKNLQRRLGEQPTDE